ncbi:MAG TPA: hypothetical protein VN213_17755 [Solirubrobacteraceae bacterium]|nr:hypothetical protein [Solirubrobacteraceae bacterium]
MSADGLEARTWLAWHGEGLHARRARRGRRRVATGSARPPPGTLAAGREAFARRHPALYAGHHAAAGVGKVLAGLIGASLLVGLLPDISIGLPLPSIDLPLPSIDLPGIALPQPPEPPAWLRAVLDSAKCWGPILAGIAYAVVEYRRRRRHGMARRHESQRRGGGAGGSPARGGERPAGR